MKYVYLIDELMQTKIGIDGRYWASRPVAGFGLLKWKIRFIGAWAVLSGKADAVTFYKQ